MVPPHPVPIKDGNERHILYISEHWGALQTSDTILYVPKLFFCLALDMISIELSNFFLLTG